MVQSAIRLRLRQPKYWIPLLAVVLIVIITSVVVLTRKEAPILERMNIELRSYSPLPVHAAQEWSPRQTADEEGFVLALENEQLALLLHPDTTQLKVQNKDSGYVWRSNPTAEQLSSETVKGMLLNNLQSVFLLELSQLKSGGMRVNESTNSLDKRMEKTIGQYDGGIQITYNWPKFELKFVIQYELTQDGLKVIIPNNGIQDLGDSSIININMLPFFGSATAGSDGYFFVPEGPGGLIQFERHRKVVGQGYNYRLFGSELSSGSRVEKEPDYTPIAYPVFGAKTSDNAYLAIVREGEYETRIKGLTPGMKSSRYSLSPEFVYREEYNRKTGRFASAVITLQEKRAQTDRVVEYRFMSGEKANYYGMAELYRNELIANGTLRQQLNPVSNVPLNLDIIGGGARKAFNRDQYMAVTTFAQAEEIVRDLTEAGVQQQRIVFSGWQHMGGIDPSDKFPIESKLGGKSAAKQFVEAAQALGHHVLFEDSVVWMNSNSSISPKWNAVYGMNESVYYDPFDNSFLLRPDQSLEMAYHAMNSLEKLGVDGIRYSTMGKLVFQDFNPNNPLLRKETAERYKSLLTYTRDRLGLSAVSYGFVHTLPGVDTITNYPIEASTDFLVDETVPFYPIVLHGYVSYSAAPGNLRSLPDELFLKSIEYGAIPAFVLSHDSVRDLKETNKSSVYSGKYENWRDKVIEEYQQFDRLASVYHQPIIGHRKVEQGVYETKYGDGTRVIVDYNRGGFEVIGKEPEA